MSFYCRTTGRQLQSEVWHAGPVQYLEEDMLNGLIMTYSDYSGFIVVGRVDGAQWSEVRQLRGNFVGKELNSIVLSCYHSLVAFIMGTSVFLCDYEQFRILSQLNFNEERPTCVAFVNGLELLLIGTSSGLVLVYEVRKEEVSLKLKIRCSEKKAVTHVVADIRCRKIGKKTQLDSCLIFCALRDGLMVMIDLGQHVQKMPLR